MVVKLLGGIDFFIGIIFGIYGVFLILFNLHVIPGVLISALGIVLLVKGLIFVIGLDFVSFLDVIFGIIIISSVNFKLPFVIIAFVSIFLIQKGAFSFLD